MINVYFVADTHFGHYNIFKYSNRKSFAKNIEEHDSYIIDLWNKKIKKNDTVYVLGDFSFHNVEKTKAILAKLNGRKHLILGNHDASVSKLPEMFESVSQLKFVTFKENNYSFLKEPFELFLSHYPIASWAKKEHGSINVHGHCHGKYDDINDKSKELRIDVGFDSKLSNLDIVSLEQLYVACKKITKGKTFVEYRQQMYEKGILTKINLFIKKTMSIFASLKTKK